MYVKIFIGDIWVKAQNLKGPSFFLFGRLFVLFIFFRLKLSSLRLSIIYSILESRLIDSTPLEFLGTLPIAEFIRSEVGSSMRLAIVIVLSASNFFGLVARLHSV